MLVVFSCSVLIEEEDREQQAGWKTAVPVAAVVVSGLFMVGALRFLLVDAL